MCQSKAEGGKRCDAHLEEAKDKAKKKYEDDPTDENKANYQKHLREYMLTERHVKELLKKGDEESAEKIRALLPQQKRSALSKVPESVRERCILASDPTTAAPMQALLAKDKSINVRRFLAQHSQNIKVLHHLAKDEDPKVTYAVARSEHTDPRTLSYLYRTGKPELVPMLASHKHLPADLYEPLSRMSEGYIARDIAKREDCPVEILERLAQSKSYTALMEVAQHSKLNANMRASLTETIATLKYDHQKSSIAYAMDTNPAQ